MESLGNWPSLTFSLLCLHPIIFVPIGIIIARTLGYDALTGAAMVILGAASGFSGGMLNPFTVGVVIVRKPQPENIGSSATVCATPTVKGFNIPWHKPLLNYQCSQAGVYVQLSIYLS
jgi:hypothetical protein